MSRTVTMRGVSLDVEGEEVMVGKPAPNFTLEERTLNGIEKVSLSDFKGRVLILNVVLSLDTGVCSTQTKRLNEEIKKLPDNVDVLTVSMDLPFAQARFAAEEGIERERFGSDHLDANFAKGYGTLIRPTRLEQRSLFVIDKNGILRYAQYVPEATHEPVYEPALQAAKAAASE